MKASNKHNLKLPFKISVLVFLRNKKNQLLLIQRQKSPNKGLWSPIGGKLEMESGESAFECAIRETAEETGFQVKEEDLHLFCMISEKAYEGQCHWLMFLFDCRKQIEALPPQIEEGPFSFFSREEIHKLAIPETDRNGLWQIYDRHKNDFVALRADCIPSENLKITVEETFIRANHH